METLHRFTTTVQEATLNVGGMILTLWLPFLVLIASALWLRKNRLPEGTRLLPGPPGYPVIGLVPFFSNIFDRERLKKWAAEYGPVFRLKVGFSSIVILNDFESIKEVLNMKEVFYRSGNLVVDQAGMKGLLSLNGQAWIDNRRFCLQVLRDLGFGKTALEEQLKEEAEYLVAKIGERRGEPFLIEEFLVPSTSNNITALVFGKRYPFEDPQRQFLDDRLKRVAGIVGSRNLSAFLPSWLRDIVSRIPKLKVGEAKRIFDEVLDFSRKEIKEHEDTMDEYTNRDFIDAYLKKIKEDKDNPHSSFHMRTLIGNIFSFFGAGSSTVQSTLQWNLLLCAHQQESVQARIQGEIDRVIGRERAPAWRDHTAMPFTVATIWEVYRWRTVTPLGVPRIAGEDFVYKNYFIPKGVLIMANLRAVHLNPDYWENPEEFNPSRFLKDDGSGLLPKPDKLIPFSVGKRMCPGEMLATAEIFLYLTAILQKYTVLPGEHHSVDLSSATTAFNLTQKQKLRFVQR